MARELIDLKDKAFKAQREASHCPLLTVRSTDPVWPANPRALAFWGDKEIKQATEVRMALLESTTRIALNNILWAPDLSASSEIALPYVVALARGYGARVYVTHVVPTVPPTLLPQRVNGDLFEERRRRAEEMVRDLDSSGRLQGIRHLVLIREGEPAETLRRTILDYDIDLIVLGTRGRTGMKKSLLGPTVEALVLQGLARCSL